VGREPELATLESLLARAIEGYGAIVFLVGESGIGKTALCAELLRRTRARPEPQLTLCRGRCTEHYGPGEAYLPFLDGLGSLLAGSGRQRTAELLRTYAPTWCLHLPAVFADPDQALRQRTVGATQERMLREMGDAFEEAAREYPVLLFLEDIQWADPSSVDLVSYLGGRIARQRMLVLASLRGSNLEATNPPLKRALLDLQVLKHCHQIALGPLPAAAVADYLDRSFSPHRFPENLAPLVAKRTEGHPLFLASLLQFLLERGDFAFDGSAWALTRPLSEPDFPAPQSVRAMIARKLGTLSEEDRAALQQASVLGREFLSTQLASLMGSDEIAVEEQLDRLARAHRVIEAGGEEELPAGGLAMRYRFVHALYAEVLYEGIVSTRRLALHRRAAEQLAALYGAEAPRHAARLAMHFEQGRDFASAISFLTHAGDNAARFCAYSEALRDYDHALSLVDRLPADAQERRHLALFERRGAAHHALGRFDLAARDYAVMLERARAEGAAEHESAALAGLCAALFFARRIEEMAVRAHEGLCAAARSGVAALDVGARLQVALLLQDEGELTEVEPLLVRVLADARRLELEPALLGALVQRGTLHYWRSEYSKTEECHREALALSTRLGNGFWALLCLMFLGASQANQGRLGEALRTTEEGIALARRNDDRFWLPRLVSQLGWIHRELMDYERAQRYDRESLAIAREQQTPWAPQADALLNLFVDCAQAGRAADAHELQEQLAPALSEGTFLRWFVALRLEAASAEHWFLRGDLATSERHAQALLDSATPLGAGTYIVTARKVLADIALGRGDTSTAEAHLEAARLVLGRADWPLIAWRTYMSLARLRARQADVAGAAHFYREAEAVIGRLAASVEDPALRHSLLDAPLVREVIEGAAAV